MRPEGADRYRTNRAKGIVDRGIAIPHGDAPWTDHMALVAEWLVAYRYGQEHQVQVKRPTPCDLIGIDRKPLTGRARYDRPHLDVKWTRWQPEWLKLDATDDDIRRRGQPPHRQHICTAYVLVGGNHCGKEPCPLCDPHKGDRLPFIAGWTWGHSLVRTWDTSVKRHCWLMKPSHEAFRQGTTGLDILMAATFGLTRR